MAAMLVRIRHLFGWLTGVFRSRADLILENLALRQQLLALHAQRPRPRLGSLDRLFWVTLRRLLAEYIRYYHDDRTHLGLEKDTPTRRTPAKRSPAGGRVESLPRLGGLHHRYTVAA